MEGSPSYLRDHVGKIFFRGMFAVKFTYWKSCPSEIGFNGVNMVFPDVTLLLKVI